MDNADAVIGYLSMLAGGFAITCLFHEAYGLAAVAAIAAVVGWRLSSALHQRQLDEIEIDRHKRGINHDEFS